MLLILSAVLVKVGLLQTFEGDQLRSAAAQQWTRDRPLRAQRGSIFDRNGEELALSVPASTVAVNPKQVTDPEGTAQVFADVLGLDDDAPRRARRRRWRDKDKGFVYVARQVDTDDAEQLAAPRPPRRDDLPRGPPHAAGRRHRPQRDRAHRHRRHRHRRAGEAVRQRARRHGRRASRSRSRPAAARSPAASRSTTRPIPGADIVLTIDRSVQYAAEQALLTRVGQLGAHGGQAIVMDTKTGEVLAMASVRINSDSGVYEITSGNYSAGRRLRARLGRQGHHDLRRPSTTAPSRPTRSSPCRGRRCTRRTVTGSTTRTSTARTR